MINLRDNVNLWGPPPAAAAVLADFAPSALALYPSTAGGSLVPALAGSLGVRETEIVVGCGSDDLINAAFGLAGPGSALAYPDPTFAMVAVYGKANRLRLSPVRFDDDVGRNVEGLLRAEPGVIYLCSPNNPTGGVMPPRTVQAVVEQATGVVVLDAAYAEFCDQPDWIPTAIRSNRLLILRTLSKAWGLAGLRIGYAVGSEPLIAALRARVSPFPLNAVGERVAVAALARDRDWMRACAGKAARNRERLVAELRARSLCPLSSSANFVLLPIDQAHRMAARLAEAGIAVRAFTGLRGIGDAIRIGVGPWELMESFLDRLGGMLPCA